MANFQDLLDGVANYYGSGAEQWANIAKNGITADNIDIIRQVPGVDVTVSNSGNILGWDYNNPFEATQSAASQINSNVQSGLYGTGSFNANLPASGTVNPQTGNIDMTSGARVASTGNVLASVADKVTLGVAGVALGSKLGAAIDSTLYNLAPDFWEQTLPTLNPQTWDDMATTKLGKTAIRALFGLQDDEATMYLDERILAYTYQALLDKGYYNPDIIPETISATDTLVTGANNLGSLPTFWSLYETVGNNAITRYHWDISDFYNAINNEIDITQYTFVIRGYQTSARVYAIPLNSYVYFDSGSNQLITRTLTEILFVANGGGNIPYIEQHRRQNQIPYFNNINGVYSGVFGDGYLHAFTNQINTIVSPSIDGASPNINASIQINPDLVINPATGQKVTPQDDLDDVLQALKTAYPDLFNDSVYEDIPQSDGQTIQRINYIPVPYPNNANTNQPTTDMTAGINPQTDPQVSPETRGDALAQELTDTITSTTEPPDTGNNDTPDIVLPVGNASALWSVYNPTLQEINSFGSWLWSSNFIDQLLKMFSDPMQAIIGLHKIFVPPITSARQNIVVGYLDSGVSALTVPTQYSSLDCGTIDLLEYFGNVFDYAPYTRVYIYLPFVGFKQLDTSLVIRATLQVIYHCDAFTGAGLVDIIAIRDGNTTTIYSFSCDLACKYPLSQGSYMGIVSSIASLATGILTGNAMLTVGSVVNAISNSKTQTELSGSYTGNSGAMGIKKPYLVIIRPQTQIANDFEMYQGYSDNRVVTISDISGYAMFTDIHTNNIQYATESELSDIVTYLSNGVVI